MCILFHLLFHFAENRVTELLVERFRHDQIPDFIRYFKNMQSNQRKCTRPYVPPDLERKYISVQMDADITF